MIQRAMRGQLAQTALDRQREFLKQQAIRRAEEKKRRKKEREAAIKMQRVARGKLVRKDFDTR